MSWRNHATHREESRAVKDALIKSGYKNCQVGHGRGTAWGWLEIKASTPKPENCYCGSEEYLRIHRVGRCNACQDEWSKHYRAIINIAHSVTGRHGEYDGEISVDLDLV